MGASKADGMSCTTATTPLATAPPRSYAYTSIATQVAHSATLKAIDAISIRRNDGSRAVAASDPRMPITRHSAAGAATHARIDLRSRPGRLAV